MFLKKGEISERGMKKRGEHHHRILYFPVLVSRGGRMFLKKGGISRREHEKRKGELIPLSTLRAKVIQKR